MYANLNSNFSISIVLDIRRPKASGLFPVKLRVFTSTPRKQVLYKTNHDLSKNQFEDIWKSRRPKKENQQTRLQLQAIEAKANDVASHLSPFSFQEFERKYFRRMGDGILISYHYEQIISDLIGEGRLGTADSYSMSQKSLSKFTKYKFKVSFSALTFFDIDEKWLAKYEDYMLNTLNRSSATVGIYLRPLRAIFNIAIIHNEIDKELYPFGKRKYQIPTGKKVKKALTNDQLRILFSSEPKSPQQEKAKDFWFLSYSCSGMNIKDLALLKVSDIKRGTIAFYRAKTRITGKSNPTLITVALNDYSKAIIEKYTDPKKSNNDFIFDIIKRGDSAEKQQLRIKTFNRFINQHIKKLCKTLDLPEETSFYWARHSFATNSIRKGASMEFIQESLGHTNMNTTKSYFAGFDNEAKKEFADKLMDFGEDKNGRNGKEDY